MSVAEDKVRSFCKFCHTIMKLKIVNVMYAYGDYGFDEDVARVHVYIRSKKYKYSGKKLL